MMRFLDRLRHRGGARPRRAAAPRRYRTLALEPLELRVTPALTIPDNSTASQTFNVSGMTGTITDVRVTFTGLTTPRLDDLDFLLVHPNGATNLEFWSDVGGTNAVTNLNIVIADAGAAALPDNFAPLSGGLMYKPSDYGVVETASNWSGLASITINHPTSNGTATFASVFNGLAPNGNWTLWVRDDDSASTASTLGSWSLTVSTATTTPSVTTQPQNAITDVGRPASFTAAASGTPTPSVQWYVRNPGESSFTVVSGATSNTLSIASATSAQNGSTYHAVFTNTAGFATTNDVTLAVNPAPTLGTPGTTQAIRNVFFSTTVDVLNGTAPFSNLTQSGLPTGLSASLSGATITISGTPTTTGTFNNVQLGVTDAAGATATRTYSLGVVDQGVAPSVTTQPQNRATTVSRPTSFTAAATGSPTPTVQWFVLTPGAADFTAVPGATSTTLAIASATLAQNGSLYQAVFTNAAGAETTNNATLIVNPAPTLGTPTTTLGLAGQPFSSVIVIGGGTAPFGSLTESGLPTGLTASLSGIFIVLSGTPTTTGTFNNVQLGVTDAAGVSASQTYTLTVNRSPTITSAAATTYTAGTAKTFVVTTAPGVPAPLTLSATGTMPAGLTFTDNLNGTATITGTPAAETGGVYRLLVTASNGATPNATQNFTLTVNEAPAITSENTTTFTAGLGGGFTITTLGFPRPTIGQAGSLPSGVTFVDNHNGTASLSGRPDNGTEGTYLLGLTAFNSAGSAVPQIFTLTVEAAPPTITSVQIGADIIGFPNQRSRIDRIVVAFNDTLIQREDEAFSLVRNGTQVVPLQVTWNSDFTRATLTFGGTLSDGRYQLSINGDLLFASNGIAVDADGDHVAGGMFTADFHRLFGDGDGDGDVDFSDLAAFREALGNPTFNPIFDFDGDGDADFTDLAQFRQRLGNILPP